MVNGSYFFRRLDVQQPWPLSVIFRCFKILWSLNWIGWLKNNILKKFGYNKVELRSTQHMFQWQNCGRCSLHASPLWGVNWGGLSDFTLWVYLEEKVYQHRFHSLEELKIRIKEEVAAIPINTCQNAVENFRNRLHQWIASRGHPLFDVISKHQQPMGVMYWSDCFAAPCYKK